MHAMNRCGAHGLRFAKALSAMMLASMEKLAIFKKWISDARNCS
jgi:hypothetical protein